MDAMSVRAVLARAPGLRASHVQALHAAACGEMDRLIHVDTLSRAKIQPPLRDFLTAPDRQALQQDLEWIRTSGAQLLLSIDAGYPQLVRHIPQAPGVLFVLGRAEILSSAQLAVVGSRSATPGGRQTARDFAETLARAGLTITSGLALGIDAASHEGALRAGGSTIAVCGTGLDQVYPTQHASLAMRIRDNGALVSQFPPRTPPFGYNFPQRNRLISALTLGTLVVEAAGSSGALSTATLAAQYGRDVFAIPGSIHNPLACGCHKLIRDGAILVQNPAQVLSELNFSFKDERLVQCTDRTEAPVAMDKGYEMLLDALGFEPATVDVLVARTGFPGGSIASMLLILELEGRVAPYPGGRFGRISK